MQMDNVNYTSLNFTNQTDVNSYVYDSSNYGVVPFKAKRDPTNAWAMPIVTGHKYMAHWGPGLDFTSMQIKLSPKWLQTDKNLYMVMNFSDVRAEVDVITGGQIVPNMTLVNKTATQWQTGDNVIYNDTATKQIHLVINGKNMTKNNIIVNGYQCAGPCLAAIKDLPLETTVRYWSQPTSWPLGALPKEGDNVTI